MKFIKKIFQLWQSKKSQNKIAPQNNGAIVQKLPGNYLYGSDDDLGFC